MSGRAFKAVRLGVFMTAVAFVSACMSSDPGKQEMAAGTTDKAVILMKTRPGEAYDYSLELSVYDVANRKLTSDPFNGHARLRILPRQASAAQVVTPGTYVIKGLSQQDFWTACYQDNSLRFDVRPGEIVYLGEFDPAPGLATIQKQARENGETTSNGRPYFYFDNIPAPILTIPQDREKMLASVEAFVRKEMPKVQGKVIFADYQPAKFGTGNDAFGVLRVCGGYYLKSAPE
jgi:hypothetical protein